MPQQPWMILHSIALVSTIFRIVQRWSASRLWWDDVLLLLPLGIDATYLASLWKLYHRSFVLASAFDKTLIDSFWFTTLLWLLVIWSCRTSLALSMARIFPPGHHSRRSFLTLAFYFVVTFILCIVTLSVVCRTGNKIMYSGESCIKAGMMATALDLSGDTLLTLVPLVTFWRVGLPQTQRRLILITFSASFMTLIPSIAFCVLLYGSIIGNFNLGSSEALITTMMAHVEAATSMIVCNLIVIIPFFYRIFRRRQDSEAAEESTEKSEETLNMHLPRSDEPTSRIEFTEISDPTWTSLEQRSEPLSRTFEVASDHQTNFRPR
ncbi:hypothetical protein K443DRAFT_96805 [Laccaria amethystina LaAM-08-1]|uniref:Rhodopsin domain-containing protein n=1 Tax=Laccaria amethystina LaAM-08-1 TaxID=1095629 RepID=A0A0C9WTS8_9AGAR|nr:hypothetical protein K443DRAFT_96805 [Laccaria amethystina LaAM-08-1]